MTGSDPAKRAGTNPFVGPRPFKRGETLYGRERELRELYYLLSAERIVLLHSPSGAGKSSLVQAGLLGYGPVRERFDVWRPTRLNQDLPEAHARGVNRYVTSALLGFEEGIPEKLRRPPEELVRQSLTAYVEGRPRRPEAPDSVFLVFDQFEEILTADPLAIEAKREFFDQLGELLHDPQIWALFVLREDYLAPLDPFASQVPTHLNNRFRIDLLDASGAREAMVEPARVGGRAFPAVDRLVHDLATTKVQQPDGSFRDVAGRYVEPVQLQVACRRLWDEMPESDRSIDEHHLERFGDVDEALRAYYETAVRRAAGETTGSIQRERAIREWFRDKLLTADGIRSQVRKGESKSEGLANSVVDELLNTHLVRGEQRASATWYELAHDRLVEPVRTSNEAWFDADLEALGRYYPSAVQEIAADAAGSVASERAIREWFHNRLITEGGGRDKVRRGVDDSAGLSNDLIDRLLTTHLIRADTIDGANWLELAHERLVEPVRTSNDAWFQEHLQPFQREAVLWVKERRRPELLAHGDALDEAERWADAHAAELTEDEKDFLSKSRDKRAALANEQRWNRGVRWAAAISLVFALGFLALASWANRERRAARAHAARADALRAYSERAHIDEALLLALDASQVRDSFDARTALISLQGDVPRLVSVLARQTGMLQTVAFNADGSLLAAGGDGKNVVLIDLRAHTERTKDVGQVHALNFSGDGRLAVAGTGKGRVRLYDRTLTELASFEDPDADDADTVRDVLFHPDGRVLFAAGETGIRVWNTSAPTKPVQTIRDIGAIKSIAFDEASDALYSAGNDGLVRAWSVGADGSLVRTGTLPGSPAARLNGVALSPDGRTVAAVTDDGRALIWKELDEPPRLAFEGRGSRRNLETVDFAPNGKLFAISGEDGTVRTFRVDDLSDGPTIRAHPDKISWLDFSDDGTQLATVGLDRTARLYHLESRFHRDVNEDREGDDYPGEGRPGFDLRGHHDRIEGFAFSADSAFAASGSRDGRVALWDVAAGERKFVRQEHQRPVSAIAFTADGGRFASADQGGRVVVWRVDATEPESSFTLAGQSSESQSDAAWIWSIAFNPSRSDEIALASNGGVVHLKRWDPAQEEWSSRPDYPRLLHGSENRVRTVAFASDGKLLASGGGDGTVAIWSPTTPQIVRCVVPGTADCTNGSDSLPGLMRVLFTPDGTKFFATTDDGKIHRYTIEASGDDGLPALRVGGPAFVGHDDEARCLAVDPTGRFLASGSSDQTVWLWDLDRGEPVYRLLGHRDQVQDLVFDGHFIVSGSSDETVRFWGFYRFDSPNADGTSDLETIQRRACEIANRDCRADWRYTVPARQ